MEEDLKLFQRVWSAGTKNLAKCTGPKKCVLPRGARDTEKKRKKIKRKRERLRYQYIFMIYNCILKCEMDILSVCECMGV